MLSAIKDGVPGASFRQAVTLLVLLCLSLTAASAFGQEVHYKFDEGTGPAAADATGNGHDATLSGNPAWIAGQLGTALSFDGNNDYADTTYTTNLPQWSVALWVRSPSAPRNGSSSGPVHREKNFAISWDHPASAFRGVAALSVGGNWYAASFGPISANTWYHLAASYDGETLSTYKDGALVSTNTDPSGPPDAEAATLKVGRHATANNYFEGDVDDVFIFSRAIDLAEVHDLMTASGNPDTTPPQISNIAVTTLLSDSATISWLTDEPSDSRVNWGTDTNLGQMSYEGVLVTDHSIDLTGLSPSTTYYFEVVSEDSSQNTATDNNGNAFYSFVTPDTDPAPTISNVQVSNLTATSATITWNTELPADSSVDYGETGALGSNQSDSSQVTSHSVTLSGLSAGTGYLFQVSSTNAGGTTTDDNGSSLYSLTTPAGASAPTISNVQVSNLTATSATITWNTELPADSSVDYGETGALGSNQSDSSQVTSHSVTLSGLSAGTGYLFQVSSTSAGGTTTDDNGSSLYSLTTPAGASAPTISNVQVSNLTATSATITWNTELPADSSVDYGETGALGSNQSDSSQVTSHSVTLSGLSAGTGYLFQVSSTNAGGTTTDDNGGSLYSLATALSGSGPDLHYKFDEGSGAIAIDSSGNGQNATLIGSPTYGTGQFGTALSFDGNNDYADTTYTTNLPQWSVALWVRSPSAPGGGAPNGPVHREKNFAISWDHPASAFRGVAALSVGGNWYAASFGPISANTWYHLAASYDGETLSTYKDGALVSTNTDPSGPPDAEAATLKVGRHATANNYFEGDVDDVFIFSRAIDLAEVHDLMTASGNPDTTPPQISNIAVTTLLSDSATISWLTDEPSDSRVNWGTDTNLGQMSYEGVLVTDHSIDLTGLSPSTTYYFEVVSEDSSQNTATDNNGNAFYSFVTPDTDPAPTISNVQVSNLTATSATITWNTELPADSSVDYGETGALGSNQSDSSQVTSHSVTLSGLSAGTGYLFQVSSTNAGGTTTDDNGSSLYSLTTPAGASAPTISNVQVSNLTATSATITWNTELPADSSVDYGETGALGSNQSDSSQVTSHSVTLSGLSAGTGYLFQVSSTNAGGTTTDDNGGLFYSFTTSSTGGGLTFSNIQVIDVTATSATVTWDTNVPSHASVERNIEPEFFLCPRITFNPQSDPSYCTVWDQIPSTTPVVRLAELQPNTEYHIRVRGAVSDGGTIWSQIHPQSFTTLPSTGLAIDLQIDSSNDDAHEGPGASPVYSHTDPTIIAGVPATTPVIGGWRWDDLAIPAGVTITDAWVELHQYDFGDGFSSLLALENSPSPVPFSATSTPPDRWNVRTQWEIRWAWPHTDVVGSTITTASLVNGVQELVDNYGGIDSIVLLERGMQEEPFLTNQWSAYDLDPSLSARLHIQYVDPQDQTTPIISNVQVVPSITSATITWNTNENSNSRVNFGQTTSLGQTEFVSPAVTSHSVTIDTLSPSTTYFFEVLSQDGGLNVATDDNGGVYYLFQTDGLPSLTEYLNYAFDTGSGNTAVDSSGNTRDGTLINAPTWVAGQFGTALSFNGNDNYVETGLSEDLGEWSVALWVRSPNAPGAGPANGPVHREKNFAISWDHPSSAFRGVAALSAGGNWYAASFGQLSPDIWHHLVATYDGETLKTYKNGIFVTANEGPSGAPDTESASLKVGRHATAPNHFEGEIDELAIYERALTPAEVASLASPPSDSTSPTISGVGANPAVTDALVTWSTDEPSDSMVSYGTTPALGSSISSQVLTINHSVALPALDPDTTYFFEVQSQDGSGNLTIDDNNGALYQFTTQAEPPPQPDSDLDGMPDAWEQTWGLDPGDPADASVDLDGDGVTNLIEYQQGTNPRVLFPATNWLTKTPAETGLDSTLVDQFVASVGGNGVIVRDGYLVRSWGNSTASGGSWWSASKPVLSTMMLFAVKEGKLSSVDEEVGNWVPNLIAKDAPMTFRHLANNTSGYMLTEGPGEAWAYNDYAVNLYLKVLFEEVFAETGGANPADSAAIHPQRLGALGLQDGNLYIPWTDGGWEIGASARDFARIGWFWLNRGEWDGQQLIAKNLFDLHMRVGVPANMPLASGNLDPNGDYLSVGTNGGEPADLLDYVNGNGGRNIYGFDWWFNGQPVTTTTRMWPEVQGDVVGAVSGNRGSMFVIPGLNLVVAARQSSWGFDEATRNARLKLLMDAAGVPVRPTGLVATPNAGGHINLDWDDSTAADFAGYNIYHSPTSGGPYDKLNTSLVTSSAFVDSQPNAGDNFYVVTVVDSDGMESPYADEASATAASSGN